VPLSRLNVFFIDKVYVDNPYLSYNHQSWYNNTTFITCWNMWIWENNEKVHVLMCYRTFIYFGLCFSFI